MNLVREFPSTIFADASEVISAYEAGLLAKEEARVILLGMKPTEENED
jgi:hypothetical protein